LKGDPEWNNRKPNIVEFDLKGFFDSVKLAELNRLLEELGIPERYLKILKMINES
jgi:hypothetical protein